MEQWEMEESSLVVSANTTHALGCARSNVRPGEKAVDALVIFQATKVRKATAVERRAAGKAAGKAERKAERDAAKRRRLRSSPLTVADRRGAG
jgi:hypothetical protein